MRVVLYAAPVLSFLLLGAHFLRGLGKEAEDLLHAVEREHESGDDAEERADERATYKRLLDEATCQTFTEIIVTDAANPYVLGTRKPRDAPL